MVPIASADDAERLQREVCARFGVPFTPPDPDMKVGIALDVRMGRWPLLGMRLLPVNGTTGWYLCADQKPSTAPDYYRPLHARHVADWNLQLLPYLALPPGWAFLIAPGYEDVWFDRAYLVE